jgi:hypothetical protein
MLGLFFEPDDGGTTFLRNVRELPDYRESDSRKE